MAPNVNNETEVAVDNVFWFEHGDPEKERPQDDEIRGTKRFHIILAATCCLLIVGGIAGLVVFLVTRPGNIDTIDADENSETPPTLVKMGKFRQDGFVAIETTQLVRDMSVVFYYITINHQDSVADAFWFTETQDFASIAGLGNVFEVENITLLEFPHRLDASFVPADYTGGVLIDSETTTIIDSVALTDIDMKTTATADDNMTAALPPVLFSRLSGNGYSVGGSITIDYRQTLDDDGNIVTKPFLIFENIITPDAPGPYLYLTRRSQQGRSIRDEDIYVPIEGTERNSFSKEGSFSQDLNVDLNILNEFRQGSWIVWCDPFSVRLGGGPISIKQTTRMLSRDVY